MLKSKVKFTLMQDESFNVTIAASDETVTYGYGLRDSNQCVIALQITDPSSRQRERPT
jgi:hypothetical protein